MSSRDLYEELKKELGALMKRYKSPDLNAFIVLTNPPNADEDLTPTPSYMYYSGALREISAAIGHSIGNIVLGFEQKAGISDTRIREEVLQLVIGQALQSWAEENEESGISDKPEPVKTKPEEKTSNPFFVIKKPGNA